MRLQQSRSTAVISAPGIAQAVTGTAASNMASVETPILNASLTFVSLFLTVLRSNSSITLVLDTNPGPKVGHPHLHRPGNRATPGQQFLERKWLDEVIVG